MKLTSALARSMLFAAIAGGLTACGGGGDESTSESSAAAASPTMEAEAARGARAPVYHLTDLGTLCVAEQCAPGYHLGYFAMAVNDRGEVAGWTKPDTNIGPPYGRYGPFIYSKGKLRYLEGFPAQSAAFPTGINDKGEIVGTDETSASPGLTSWVYDSNGPHYLTAAVASVGGRNATVRGINNRGEVVGSFALLSDAAIQHAFVYAGGVVTDLGTFGAISARGTAINRHGQIAGTVGRGSATQAFRYRNGNMVDLGTLPGSDASEAAAINDDGTVVGLAWFNSNANANAFVAENRKMKGLGRLSPSDSASGANGVSNDGTVIGESDGKSFVYRDGVMYDVQNLLDTSGAGWRSLTLRSISPDKGLIAGDGVLNGESRAFILTPVVKKSNK